MQSNVLLFLIFRNKILKTLLSGISSFVRSPETWFLSCLLDYMCMVALFLMPLKCRNRLFSSLNFFSPFIYIHIIMLKFRKRRIITTLVNQLAMGNKINMWEETLREHPRLRLYNNALFLLAAHVDWVFCNDFSLVFTYLINISFSLWCGF